MSKSSGNRISLTAELVALAERTEPDPGPEPGTEELSDDDYRLAAEKLLSEYAPATLHVFAYGSLIWNPVFDISTTTAGTANGWHRAFCFTLTRWRGTRELPGLMMALDKGGSCNGLVFELTAGDVKQQLINLLDRELDAKHPTNIAKWISVSTPNGKVKALTFVADKTGPAYAKRSLEQVADVISRAAGHLGSNAIYLQRTVEKLHDHGIRDRNLWALQRMVAEHIIARHTK
ncbi:gamma-glutamylcyclotransferase [Aestuariivirga litoralis]|nr:gamma-glutamylcyclotransferase [Aestuariivirga litoralis]